MRQSCEEEKTWNTSGRLHHNHYNCYVVFPSSPRTFLSVLWVSNKTTGQFYTVWLWLGKMSDAFNLNSQINYLDNPTAPLLNQTNYLRLHNLAFGNMTVVNCLLCERQWPWQWLQLLLAFISKWPTNHPERNKEQGFRELGHMNSFIKKGLPFFHKIDATIIHIVIITFHSY